MAKIKPNTAAAKHTVDRFSGIRNSGVFLGSDASEMLNFRIREDGSLEKRCGWRTHLSLPSNIRGVWRGSIDNQARFLIVAGSTVYSVDPETTALQAIYSLAVGDGSVRFFVYLDRLFLLDGRAIYRFLPQSNTFGRVFGYVPLIGKHWHPISGGDVLEPMNLLNRYYRVEYYNPGGYEEYVLPYAATLIRVWIDEEEVYTYDFVAGSSRFTLENVTAGSVTVLALSYENTMTAEILSCKLCATVSDGKHNALLLGGGSSGYRIFGSIPVSKESLSQADAALSQADELYFPAQNLVFAGDAEHPITALCSYHDRVIAFDDDGAVSIGYGSSDSYVPNVIAVDHSVGCANGAVVAANGSLFAVHRHGMRRIHASPSQPEVWTVTEVASPVREELSDLLGGSPHIAYNPITGELWLCDEAQSSGSVWIYRAKGEDWYRFDNIYASRFLQLNDLFGFITGGRICLFDEALLLDDDSMPIPAVYRSGYLTLDTPLSDKRILTVSLLAATTSDITLTLESEHRSGNVQFPAPDGALRPLPREARCNLVRFRMLRFALTTAGTDRPRFYRIAFLANP